MIQMHSSDFRRVGKEMMQIEANNILLGERKKTDWIYELWDSDG